MAMRKALHLPLLCRLTGQEEAMRSLSEHAARRAASVQRSSATSVRTISDDPAARCVNMLRN